MIGIHKFSVILLLDRVVVRELHKIYIVGTVVTFIL